MKKVYNSILILDLPTESKNMPASSKSQQKFFGLVKAVQRGDVPASKVTSNVRQAAKDTSPEDVADMASTNVKGLPDKVKVPHEENEGINFYEIVSRYNEYGNILKREHTLSELGQQLADIAEYAEHTLTNEMDDWFDKHTISRNIKEMRGYAKEFLKIAQEADSYNQRMTALYDDMGRVLERYFDIMDSHQQAPEDTSSGIKSIPQQNVPVQDSVQNNIESSQPNMADRVITLARHRLRGENLAKFDTLNRPLQEKVAWKIVK